jgi:uncharacterized Zn finger protein (UPF0148 family)
MFILAQIQEMGADASCIWRTHCPNAGTHLFRKNGHKETQ